MPRLRAAGTLLVALACAAPASAEEGRSAQAAGELNGFRLAPASIPVEEILPGGPPRDGIPALNTPEVLPADDAPWPDPAIVVGVDLGGERRAFPLAILVWHELVNDVVGGRPVLVSYCPLCGTAMVFDRRIDGLTLDFGVSGLLYNSDLLMFDRESESLWSQISAHAVAGPRNGARLTLIRSRIESWGAWRRRHPDTTVLSPETGHRRRYGTSPYGDYAQSEETLFPVALDDRYHPKMPTLGLRLRDGQARAYPAEELARAGGSATERFAGRSVRVAYDPEGQVFDVEAPPDVEAIEGFWFAWKAFHPETSVFTADR